MPKEFLDFTFAPHVLEDLGVNLYTSLAKALVEFVANAHDADSVHVDIIFDQAAITAARKSIKATFEAERSAVSDHSSDAGRVDPLQERILPEHVSITIQDDGCGMTRDELQHKFLVIGRRRRQGLTTNVRTSKQRIVMGRKGLGKLAGFGIAHVMEITTKVEAEPHATRITLDLDKLLGGPGKSATTGAMAEEPQRANSGTRQSTMPVPVETIDGGGGLHHGTKIVLRRLVYGALRDDLAKLLNSALCENFSGIHQGEFAIQINRVVLATEYNDFAFAYPNDGSPTTALVDETFVAEGAEFNFRYRIRFRGPRNQLAAKARGVRVYAHNRLAAAPDLLDIKTSTHGFQYTSYLDGKVEADFIDEQPADYISTDRQSLRWEAPILVPLRECLTEAMSKALNAYAKTIETTLDDALRNDEFTKGVIEGANLPDHRIATAWKIARVLAGKDDDQTAGDFYRATLQAIVAGIGHGEILSAIETIAGHEHPQLSDVIREIARLTRHEFDEFLSIVDARLRAIETLERLVGATDFRAAKNEKHLQQLFEDSPWLIDPTFFEFLTANKSEDVTFDRLARELQIVPHVPTTFDPDTAEEVEPLKSNKRPDLAFLLHNASLNRLIVVELKAPNVPLHIEHLNQLWGYMARAERFLKSAGREATRVEGYLIGTRASHSLADQVVTLDARIEADMGSNCLWRVFDLSEVLDRTKAAHRELIAVRRKGAGSAAV